MKKSILVALSVLFVLAACTTRERAQMTARNMSPTPYQERGFIFSSGGYREKLVNDKTYEISFTGNSVTSVQQVSDMVNYHAAIVGRRIGETHYRMASIRLRIVCTRDGSNTYANGTPTYGSFEELGGKAVAVDEVIEQLEASVLRPSVSSNEEQKAFLANQQSCRSQRIVRPDQMTTQSELEAEERAAQGGGDPFAR